MEMKKMEVFFSAVYASRLYFWILACKQILFLNIGIEITCSTSVKQEKVLEIKLQTPSPPNLQHKHVANNFTLSDFARQCLNNIIRMPLQGTEETYSPCLHIVKSFSNEQKKKSTAEPNATSLSLLFSFCLPSYPKSKRIRKN